MESIDGLVESALKDAGIDPLEVCHEGGRAGQHRVYKSNMLNNAIYGLTLNESRVLGLTLALLDPYQPVPEAIELDVGEFACSFGLTYDEAYNALLRGTRRLHERSLRMSGVVQQIDWLAGPVDRREGEGVFVLRLSEAIKPHLHGFTKHFTWYDLEKVARLQTVHAYRMYELFSQWRSSGEYFVLFQDFKARMGLGNKYKKFPDLVRYVIEPAIKELQAKSGLTIQWTVNRRSRGPHSLTFVFEKKDISKLARFPSAEERERRAAESERDTPLPNSVG